MANSKSIEICGTCFELYCEDCSDSPEECFCSKQCFDDRPISTCDMCGLEVGNDTDSICRKCEP